MEWSLDALRSVPAIERIVVALPAGVEAPAGTIGAAGGAERSHSVRNALAAAPGDPDDPILVQDAARPLLTRELAERCLAGSTASTPRSRPPG
jgi:2-C-methyl-D-erythritol 4-phosphate cytidylyltransferase